MSKTTKQNKKKQYANEWDSAVVPLTASKEITITRTRTQHPMFRPDVTWLCQWTCRTDSSSLLWWPCTILLHWSVGNRASTVAVYMVTRPTFCTNVLITAVWQSAMPLILCKACTTSLRSLKAQPALIRKHGPLRGSTLSARSSYSWGHDTVCWSVVSLHALLTSPVPNYLLGQKCGGVEGVIQSALGLLAACCQNIMS